MTDVPALLRTAADRLDIAVPDDTTVASDLRRGRRTLTRRRRRWAFGTTALAAVVAALAVATVTAPTAPAPAQAHGASAAAEPQPAPAMRAVALVSYLGTQPAGFTVEEVPVGWFLQGVSSVALTIAPTGTADPDPGSYLDKLVVMLQSTDGDRTIPEGPGAVAVAGRPGHLDTDVHSGYQSLEWDDGSGHIVMVQAAPNLHWGEPELVRFAAGVHVTTDAVHTHG